MTVLRELDEAGDAPVILTSYNGSFRAARGFSGKWLTYAEAIRVALVIRDARASASRRGTVRQETLLNTDSALVVVSRSPGANRLRGKRSKCSRYRVTVALTDGRKRTNQ